MGIFFGGGMITNLLKSLNIPGPVIEYYAGMLNWIGFSG